jgi:hypothetical protein
LLTKRNHKGAKKIHLAQTKRDRITLAYIKDHAIYEKQFKKIYLMRSIYFFSSIVVDIAQILVACIANHGTVLIVSASLVFLELVWLSWIRFKYFVYGSITVFQK